MAIVLYRPTGGFAGMGAAPWGPAQAQALKATLDQVTTNEEAHAAGESAYTQLRALLDGLGLGTTAGMFHDYFDVDLENLAHALAQVPDSGPLDDTWWGHPDGLRVKIEAATIDAATLIAEAPPGSLDQMDAHNFLEGFRDTLKAEIQAIASGARELAGDVLEPLAKGLGIPTWVWWLGGAGLGLYGLSKLKAVKELLA